MPFGLQISNDSGRIQIDQDYANARLIASGSCNPTAGGVNIAMPYQVKDECPIILMRPSQADHYVGGIYVRTSEWATGYPNGLINMRGQCPWDYAIFAATHGTPVSDSSAFGIEVYKADGGIAYSSRHQHACITQLVPKPADSSTGPSSGGWPNVYSINGYSEMPWLLANPLCLTYAGVGGESESGGAVMAKINSSFNSMTVDMRDGFMDYAGPASSWYPSFPAWSDRASYNPYFGRPVWFGVGRFA